MHHVDLLIHSAAQVATCAAAQPLRGAAMRDPGVIAGGALAMADGRIVAVGPSAELRRDFHAAREIDASGSVLCPGFVDPHTHVVFAGDRVNEFELKLGGTAYLDILAAGGGIVDSRFPLFGSDCPPRIAERQFGHSATDTTLTATVLRDSI